MIEFENGVRIHQLARRWAKIPLEQWQRALHRPGRMQRDEALIPLLAQLYGLFPGDGSIAHPETPIVLYHGEKVDLHAHPEWTLIYYIRAGDPPVALLIDGERFKPIPNTAIILPPNTPHAVEISKSTAPRLSVALRMEITL